MTKRKTAQYSLAIFTLILPLVTITPGDAQSNRPFSDSMSILETTAYIGHFLFTHRVSAGRHCRGGSDDYLSANAGSEAFSTTVIAIDHENATSCKLETHDVIRVAELANESLEDITEPVDESGDTAITLHCRDGCVNTYLFDSGKTYWGGSSATVRFSGTEAERDTLGRAILHLVSLLNSGRTWDVTARFLTGAINSKIDRGEITQCQREVGKDNSRWISYFNGATVENHQFNFRILDLNTMFEPGFIGVTTRTWTLIEDVVIDLNRVNPSEVEVVDDSCATTSVKIGGWDDQPIGRIMMRSHFFRRALAKDEILTVAQVPCTHKQSQRDCSDSTAPIETHSIYFADEDAATKFANALRHAADLSGSVAPHDP